MTPGLSGCLSEDGRIGEGAAGLDEIVELGGGRIFQPLFASPCSPFRLGVVGEACQQEA
jgi:hypothetical protein